VLFHCQSISLILQTHEAQMDVTKDNFHSVLKNLDDDLEKSTFLAIDTEFTGLEDDVRLSALDTPEERYTKLREGSLRFLVIQFGLSIFTYDAKAKHYMYKTYNFYIFPSTKSIPGSPDPKFLSQASSIGFLVAQGFDFNKLFKEGITYLSISGEEKMKAKVEERLKQRESVSNTPNNQQPTTIPTEQKDFMENIFSRIESFLESGEENLTVEDCSAFQRKLIFSHGRAKYPDLFFQSKQNEKLDRVMVISKVSPEQQQQLKDDDTKSEWDEVENMIGFSKVLSKITQSGKLVVGHNMLLDVCHILHQFYAELPEDYEEFKSMASAVFPKLIDTKVMATMQPFRERLPNSALGPLLKRLTSEPFNIGTIVSSPDFPAYNLFDDKAHEAGYDAFMTGVCYISMSNFLAELSKNPVGSILPDSAFIVPFIHKLHLMRSHDIPYLNLSGPDLVPNRDHVFHTSFPKEWKTADVIQLFSVYGPVVVSWIDSSSAFVTLYRKENHTMVTKNMVGLPPGCTIKTYQQHLCSSTTRVSLPPAAAVDPQPAEKRRLATEKPQSNKRKRKQESVQVSATPAVKANHHSRFEVSDDWE